MRFKPSKTLGFAMRKALLILPKKTECPFHAIRNGQIIQTLLSFTPLQFSLIILKNTTNGK
jgi:hypothetical protein